MNVATLIRDEVGNDLVACITASVDEFGRETNLSYRWVSGEDAAAHVEAAGEVELGGIDLDEAAEIYAAAESAGPIGYTPTGMRRTHRTHRCVVIERAAIGMRPGLRTTYVWPSGWPSGGW